MYVNFNQQTMPLIRSFTGASVIGSSVHTETILYVRSIVKNQDY